MWLALTALVGLAGVAASTGAAEEAGREISSTDAAAYLIQRFDFYGHTGPGSPPDGEWHYNELAQYANASRRPEGEPLNLTASNLMVLIDTDRNSSVTKDELTAFLDHVRDRRGLNGEEGRQRAAARQAKVDAEMEEWKQKAEEQAQKHGVGKDGKTWLFGDGAAADKAASYMNKPSSEQKGARARTKAPGKKKRLKTRVSDRSRTKKDEV